jgi:hypothetical protein
MPTKLVSTTFQACLTSQTHLALLDHSSTSSTTNPGMSTTRSAEECSFSSTMASPCKRPHDESAKTPLVDERLVEQPGTPSTPAQNKALSLPQIVALQNLDPKRIRQFRLASALAKHQLQQMKGV